MLGGGQIKLLSILIANEQTAVEHRLDWGWGHTRSGWGQTKGEGANQKQFNRLWSNTDYIEC